MKIINGKRLLCLLLTVILTLGVLPSAVFAWDDDAEKPTRWRVEAFCGNVTAEPGGLYEEGFAADGSVLTITYDDWTFWGYTFAYWKSSGGDIVPAESFRLYADRDVFFYPVFKDLKGDFGPWTEVLNLGCLRGVFYEREDPVTGLKEYKETKYHDHEWNYSYVDDDICRMTCVRCGAVEDGGHWLDEETVVQEGDHGHDRIVSAVCNQCGHEFLTNEGKVSEHAWDADAYGGNWEIVTEAKDGQPGVRRRHCKYCDAVEDVWYIRAEWEKYYFNNRVYFDSSDSLGLSAGDDELHYNFINDEGYNTFVYAVRPDYRANYQTYVFMWIDHADELGRKPLYLAKSRGHDDNGYYTYYSYDWAIVDYLDDVDAWIDAIDHVSCGYDRYSSSFFDTAVKYEKLYNEALIPTSESPEFLDHFTYFQYENDGSLYTESSGIKTYIYKWDDSRLFLHVDPETNVCVSYWEPNASSFRAAIESVQPIVRPDEYQSIVDGLTLPVFNFPQIPYPVETTPEAGHEHDYWSNPDSQWYAVDGTNHVKFCSGCGRPETRTHTYSTVVEFDWNDPESGVKYDRCVECGYFKDYRTNVFCTDQISADIKWMSQRISSITSMTVDVSRTPAPLNFQLRVNPYYYADGPLAEGQENRFHWHGSSVPWTYGYSNTDWFDFGIVRTRATPAGYTSGDRYSVTLKYEAVDNYVFDRWEIYDWATGQWVLFSAESTPEFNTVSWEGDSSTATAFLTDSRLKDLTLLRCVRRYQQPDPADLCTVTTEGCTFALSEDAEEWLTEGSVPAGTTIWVRYDPAQVPQYMICTHTEVIVSGEVADTVGYGRSVTVTGNTLLHSVYADETYTVSVYSEHGTVLLNGEEYYDGSYPFGTVLELTAVSGGGDGKGKEEGGEAEEYPFFYGWYRITYDESGRVEELLTADLTLTYTVPGTYTELEARWGTTEDPVDELVKVTVVNGFVTYGWGDHLSVSCMAVPDQERIYLSVDRTCGVNVDNWTLTGVNKSGNETIEYRTADESFFDVYYNSGFTPKDALVTGTGTAHVHNLAYTAGKDASCEENGHLAHWYCDGCDQYFTDENGENPISKAEVFLEALGHDEVYHPPVFAGYQTAGQLAYYECTRCGRKVEAQDETAVFSAVEEIATEPVKTRFERTIVTAPTDGMGEENPVPAFMLTGVQIRTAAPTGLRYLARISTDLINDMRDEFGRDITYGILLQRTDKLLEAGGVLDETKINGSSLGAGGAVAVEGKQTFLNVEATNTSDGYLYYTAVITGIPESNYETEVTARAYVKCGDVWFFAEEADGSVYEVPGARTVGGGYSVSLLAAARYLKDENPAIKDLYPVD